MRISRGVYDAVKLQAQAQNPKEAVGLLFGKDLTIDRLVPLSNISESRYSFELNREQVDAVLSAETIAPIAFFHSHPTDIDQPSTADIEGARAWPGIYHLIVSLQDVPSMRCWLIHDGQVIPEPLEIV
ncbi:MAG: M67 family metallopeptidase [Candidatus Lindowbacteria bacterium]|nr:M67 family metallopeptidase [Candidatus Lindowbacteria bacterium]